ncbi:sigma-70 family RNA polymerase sigma factor [Actinomadura rudentiformis]|uniref:Sigma-70 family RNA polymerase sigma factor n=1 Tax=Actinomadura rudentiformis TaxID=359158 RepID=A0A6H9YRF4_9ACTN|nr:sigma-70 family RNA polymerase sigma factor [Actinomadura rudentiformis]KAB2350278.1 sigma-70 family RNA polymerase sigma factor [Actinomadura rudentiformis]
MNEEELLAARFEEHRPRLRAVALRVLGSASEADDAVQETWLRLSRTDTTGLDNLAGWLTTVVARVSLNLLRARTTRCEEPWDGHETGQAADQADPEHQAELADSLGLALLVVLDTLNPAERLAFVLHDMFAVPFEEIAPIVERTPAATRQLASRARRRVQGATASGESDAARHRQIVAAFLAASRGGQFDALVALLAPDAVLRVDSTSAQWGAIPAHGAQAVARSFAGRAKAARPVLIDGAPGLAWGPAGRPRVVFDFTITDGKVTAIDLVADPDHLDRLNLQLLDMRSGHH